MNEFWQNKIKAFFHDPPDKALILFHESHEKRRDLILRELGIEYDQNLNPADHISSAMQRPYIPEEYRMDNTRNCNAHICFKGPNLPVFKHTLSGSIEALKEIKDFIEKNGYENALKKFGFDLGITKKFLDKSSWKKTYLSLWRLLPEEYPLGYVLPADMRSPDHSIWDHLDVTAAISSCLGDMGLFALKIPGVQEFISHSRKLSDLWASSHIFSLLLFEAAKEIADDLGPDMVVYPQLRGNPLLDHYLEGEGVNISFNKKKMRIASLPNTLLCFIPFSKAEEYERKCEEAIKRRWKEISEKVRECLDKVNIKPDKELWNFQIDKSFSAAVAYTEFFNLNSYERMKKDLPNDVREGQDRWLHFVEKSNYGHFYFPTYALLGTILTQKSRLWNSWEERPLTGKKCLMCGLRNALVERRKKDVYDYWYWNGSKWEGIKIEDEKWKNILKEGERLCAVCLVKRIYKNVFEEEFKVKPPEFESVVEIAGREFIDKIESKEFENIRKKDIELIYEHEWDSEDKAEVVRELGGKSGNVYKKLEELWRKCKPNRYYAILMMDGDRIGKMLFGEVPPDLVLGDFLHPAFKGRIMGWEEGKNFIGMKRVLSPSVHITISRAMKDFSIYKVPEIVEGHKGFLVYSGGDDVLALFPTNKVLKAAKELQEFFKKDFYEIEVNGRRRKVMGLGKHASMSAGIVFAHYKYPLYDAIEKVREAEKNAKNKYGRNAFCMTFIKRSGELLSAGGKWDFVEDFLSIVDAVLSDKISHSFIYDFLEVIKILSGEMLEAETRRLLRRRANKKIVSDQERDDIYRRITRLTGEYRKLNLPIEDIGKTLKILYDAYRGEG